jgi:hypothetical protein
MTTNHASQLSQIAQDAAIALGRHATVKCLPGEYPDGIRVAAKEMKRYEARLQRSAALPKYDIVIKPTTTEPQVT